MDYGGAPPGPQRPVSGAGLQPHGPHAQPGGRPGVLPELPCYPISADGALPQYIRTAQPTFYDNGKAPKKQCHVWANNGDRILVLKYLYAIMEPHHWDVIVFKEPQEAQDNYIKRLIGLPGETVQIIGGDVYINPKGKPDARDAVISRKPEELQQSLWQLVYDNSYYPVDEGVTPRYNAKEADGDVNRNVVYDSGPWINPWEPAAGSEKDWKKGPAMTYAGGGEGSLIFHPIPPGLPENVAKNYPPYGLNTLGYNNDFYVDDISGSGEFAPRSVVGDLRLETAWTPKGPGAASIKLILGRPNNCYRVTWSDKGLTLERYAPEPKNPDRWSFGPVTQINLTSGAHEAAEPNLAASIPAPVAGKTYQLAFDNVDRSVRFYIDGKKVLWFEENWNAALATDDVEKNPADWSNSPNLSVAVRLKQQERVNTMIGVDMERAGDSVASESVAGSVLHADDAAMGSPVSPRHGDPRAPADAGGGRDFLRWGTTRVKVPMGGCGTGCLRRWGIWGCGRGSCRGSLFAGEGVFCVLAYGVHAWRRMCRCCGICRWCPTRGICG